MGITAYIPVVHRRDTEANWNSANPILEEGEVAFSTDINDDFKVGDGINHWADLNYYSEYFTSLGTSGTSGFGISGTSGTSGATGTSGASGSSGTSGITGTSGSSGETFGTSGTSGTTPVAIVYLPQAITTIKGTYLSGDINSIDHYNDGNSYKVQEKVGTPGFDVLIEFTNIIHLNKIVFNTSYMNGNHVVEVQLYNYTHTRWDLVGVLVHSENLLLQTVEIPDDTEFIDGSGNAKFRFYHITTGNSSDELWIDYAILKNDISGASGLSGSSGTSGTSSNGTSGTSSNGTSGTSSNGTSGVNGTSGSSGSNGASGTSGTSSNGTSGSSGTNGSIGTSGASGTSGTSGTGFSTISSASDNRILTSDGSANAAVAETNLTFNGTTLAVNGNTTTNNITINDLNRSEVEYGTDTKISTGIPYDERKKFKVTFAYSAPNIVATISFVSPYTSFSYYINGKKFTVTNSEISAYTKSSTAAEGTWFFYINSTTTVVGSPNLSLTQIPWNIYDPDVLLWDAFFNASSNTITWVGEERHTAGRDIYNHSRNHAQGAVYKTGLLASHYNGLTNLSANTDNNFGRALLGISDGSFFDEDILNSIVHNDSAYTSTTDSPDTNWNLTVKQFLGFNDANTSTTPGTITFTTPHTLVTGQPISVFSATATLRGTFTVTTGGTGNSFALTTITGSNAFASGDRVVVGARIPIYFINSVSGSTYTWRRLVTTDFLGVNTGGTAITASDIATATAQYNNTATGGFSAITSTRYYPVYLLATNTTSEPIIAVLGQGQSTNATLATALTETPFQFSNLVGLNGLSIQEVVPFYRLTYQFSTQAGFNASHIRLVDATFINVRVSTTSGQLLTNTTVSNHAQLTNLEWDLSGHVGTVSKVAGFDGSGNATFYDITYGTSGTNGASGTSGTSSNGTSGSSGINGTSGTSSNGTSGTSSNGTSGTSSNGTSGTNGSSGTSSNGTSGSSGANGTSGTSSNGTSGTNGSSGTSSNGTSGTSNNGTSGTNGAAGTSGTNGAAGTSGTNGANGTSYQGINGQSGTTYTLVIGDLEKLITLSSASATTVTIPTNANVNFSVGAKIDFLQLGAGKVTFSSAATINSKNGFKSIGGQYVGVSIIQTATDVWALMGDLIT